ncbi:cAMP-regulated phosphoprotein 21, partial [Entomortierella beljakovae]
PDRVNAEEECGDDDYILEDQEVSCIRIHSETTYKPLPPISNAEKSIALEMPSPPATDPLIYTPCSNHYSPQYCIDSMTRDVENMQIHEEQSSGSVISIPCESNSQTEEEEEDDDDEEECHEEDNNVNEVKDTISPECIDKCIMEALKKRKDRRFLLDLEADLCSFIENTSQQLLEIPRLSRYYRLMVHRTADYFKIERTVDHSHTIILSKTEHTAIPASLYTQLVQEFHNTQQPPIKVLRRCSERMLKGCDIVASHHGPATHSRSSHVLPIEERQKNYCKARARIFQKENVYVHGDNNEDNDGDEEGEEEDDIDFVHNSDHEIESINLIHAAESNLQTNENSAPQCVNKSPSPQSRRSSDSIRPQPMRESKHRGQKLTRTSSTSSNTSSSSSTNMTDTSIRSDSTVTSEYYSPGLLSGFPQSSPSPPLFCGICRHTNYYGSVPGYDYHERNNHQKSFGSMINGRDQRQRHSYHNDDSVLQNLGHHQSFIHQQPQLQLQPQQHRPQYEYQNHGSSPVRGDARNYSYSPTSPSPSPSESQNCTCSQCLHPRARTRNRINNHHRPQSYPYSTGLAGPQYLYTQYSQPSPPMQSRGEMNRRFQHGLAYPCYQHHQHQSIYWPGGSSRFGSHSPNLQPNVTYEYQQRVQDSPPRCCEIYRSDGDQESQDSYQEERQGRQENEKYGRGRVTADAMAVGPSPRLFHVSSRPYPSSNGYKPSRQGITLPQQSNRQHQPPQNQSPPLHHHQQQQYQHQHYQQQPHDHARYHQTQRSSSSSSSTSHEQEQYHLHYQYQQNQSTQSHPIPIPATRRHDSMQDPSRQPRRSCTSNMSGREFGSHMVYNVDARPPKSTELFDPNAALMDKKDKSNIRNL